MDDHEIIALYRSRDERAIAETEAKYGTLMHSLSRRILGDRMDAEEVVSTSLYSLWEAIPKEEEVNLRALLCRIVRMRAIDRYRERRKHRSIQSEYCDSAEELCEILGGGETGEEALDAKELAEVIGRYLRGKDKKQQTVFTARYFLCESAEQIAKENGLSRRGVYFILNEMKKELKELLIKEGFMV